MGPVAMALRLAALALRIPLAAALRNIEKSDSLLASFDAKKVSETSDFIGREAEKTQLFLRHVGYTGVALLGNHCKWPGISCTWECMVYRLECHTCDGHLPDQINLEMLREVVLTSPKLTGDIKVFEGVKKLQVLDLHGTQVTGDILTFSRTPSSLRSLSLGNTNVFGDLAALSHPFNLHEIDLSFTKVTGTLEALMGDSDIFGRWSERKVYLSILKLAGTAVLGNLRAITGSIRIKEVDLSHTRVMGRLSGRWVDRCQELEILRLQNSSVQFAPKGKIDFPSALKTWKTRKTAMLPRLQELDLTDCPVNSPAENLFAPLLLASPTSIKAENAGLTGMVPKLKPADDADGNSSDVVPLARRLLMLGLTQNNLTELQDLPVVPKLGRILLRKNLDLKVAPRLLTEALKQNIILDLEGTKVSNTKDVAQLLKKGALKVTDMYAERNDPAGYACKDLVGTVRVTPAKFVPRALCKCLPGWYGHGATCQICPADQFSDEMGLETCKMCPPNSTAPEGSTKLTNCKCEFGDLHDGTCSCDKHQTLRDGNCILCSKLHLQCNTSGISASSASPEVRYARLELKAEEARRCLPPDVSQRCPGSDQCGLGYSGTLCTNCADGFHATRGRCKPCGTNSSFPYWTCGLVLLGAALLAAFLAYRSYRWGAPQASQASHAASVSSLLKRLAVLQAPVLLQMVQLWTVLSRLGQRSESGRRLPEVPYLAGLQLTLDDFQASLSLQCTFDAETVRTVAAISSPLLPLFLLACCATLELGRAGLGVNVALKVLPFLFIGGAYSTANLLSCQFEDGDGESLGDFAFRKALPQLHCYDRDGIGFWVDVVGYSSALAYGVLIPLGLASLLVRQSLTLQEARLFYAAASGEHHVLELRLKTMHGQNAVEALQEPKTFPKRLLAAAAAYMAVHCHGRRQVRLHDGCITTSSENEDIEEVEGLSEVKVVADAETSRKINVLRTRRLTKMLIERIMLDEAEDRLLIGSQSLLAKYTLSEDVWIYVVMKLYAVALVCCISMSDAWKWAIAFSLGMALLVGVGQPYIRPQVSQLQSFGCVCLAVASLAFAYDFPWLARVGLLAPLLLLLWQVRFPDSTEALAERLYQELESELPKLQKGESHEVIVQQLHL